MRRPWRRGCARTLSCSAPGSAGLHLLSTLAMRPVAILLSSALAVVAAAPARGVTEPRITGSYSVSGQSHSAAWSLGARLGGDSDGSVPAVLSAAGGTDIVRPCDGLTGMGTITTHIAGVADAGARM